MARRPRLTGKPRMARRPYGTVFVTLCASVSFVRKFFFYFLCICPLLTSNNLLPASSKLILLPDSMYMQD